MMLSDWSVENVIRICIGAYGFQYMEDGISSAREVGEWTEMATYCTPLLSNNSTTDRWKVTT